MVMSLVKNIKYTLTSGMFYFHLIMTTLLVLLHIGVWKLAVLISNLSFIDSADANTWKWVAFVVLEFTGGLGLTALLIVIWVGITDA